MRSNVIYLVVVIAIIAIVFSLFQPSYGSDKIDLSSVVTMAKNGQIKEIAVAGDKLEISSIDGKTFESRKENGSSIVDILHQAGLESGEGPNIKIKDKSFDSSSEV